MFSGNTCTNDKSDVDSKLRNTDFIEIFVRGIGRDVFKKSDLLYYCLEMNGNLPKMTVAEKTQAISENLISGDTERIAVAGVVAMAMPSIAQVAAKLTLLATVTPIIIPPKKKDAQRVMNLLNNSQIITSIYFGMKCKPAIQKYQRRVCVSKEGCGEL